MLGTNGIATRLRSLLADPLVAHPLVAYPLVAMALWIALLWPWSRELPRPLLRLLTGADDPVALRTTRLRLRIWRMRVRVQPFVRRRHPALFPFVALFANARGRRASAEGSAFATWSASLLSALRQAPSSHVALAHAWHRPERRLASTRFLDAWTRNDALQMLWCLRERGGNWHGIHFEKSDFARRCEAAGLASIPVLAVFRGGACETIVPGGAGAYAELFSKRDAAAAGRHAEAWTRLPDGKRFRSSSGDAVDENELIAHLCAQSAEEGDFVLQPRIRNHPRVTTITGSQALCCVRVITCRNPDGSLQLVPRWSCLKVAPPDAIVDNVIGGDAPRYLIDFENGALHTRDDEPVRVESEDEPARLPFWPEIEALCRDAHDGLFRHLSVVAWDVGIAASGPVLVEANLTFMGPGTDSITGAYCGEGPVVECMDAHLASVTREDLRRLRTGFSRRARRENGARSKT